MSKHTPCKLRVHEGNILRDVADRTVALLPVNPNVRAPAETEANAKHLAACWNACDGFNPAAVPELLTALELMLSAYASNPQYVVQLAKTDLMRPAVTAARAAIAKARTPA